jgi:hypothetical protein
MNRTRSDRVLDENPLVNLHEVTVDPAIRLRFER